MTTVQLVGSKPYIQLDPLFTTKPLNLTMVLKTRAKSGVLLYYGDSDHLAVELFHGRVRVREKFPAHLECPLQVSLNVGNPPASTMFSYAVLNDDRQHAIELLLNGKNLTMRVDGGLARSLINLGSKVFDSDKNSYQFIESIQSMMIIEVGVYYHLYYRNCLVLQVQPILEAFLTGWVTILSPSIPILSIQITTQNCPLRYAD